MHRCLSHPPSRRTALALLATALAGCSLASRTPPDADTLPDLRGAPLVLLGEVHDNAAQHALRARAFGALLAGGARPALLMEQFDREDQPALDDARAAAGATPASLVAAAGRGGWHWPHYEPFLALALAHGLPIVAANVSRADARRVIAEGLAAHGFDAAVPEDIMALQVDAIVAGHCGQLDEARARRIALAQVARDQFMARQLLLHAATGAVLLAGNGHVRSDAGVPRWLPAAERARSITIGLVEHGSGMSAPFDRVVRTEPMQRPDPCAARPLLPG